MWRFRHGSDQSIQGGCKSSLTLNYLDAAGKALCQL
jgi:hypothetical protein